MTKPTHYYDASLGRMVMYAPKKPRRVRVYLEDGSFVLAPTQWKSDVVGITEWGDLVCRPSETDTWVPQGQYVGLTGCCGADAKGCDGYIGCRWCYRECDPMLGAPIRETDIYLKARA